MKVKSLEGWNMKSPIGFVEAGGLVSITLEEQVLELTGQELTPPWTIFGPSSTQDAHHQCWQALPWVDGTPSRFRKVQ